MEPIAIVGMAFRLPGDLNDEQSFWQALKEGRDVVSKIGHERWATSELQHNKRSEPGKSITFSAGVLSRVDEFDANFFGISPREASWLDPQQRILLELAWEAMEDSGQIPSQLSGSDCAVYVGMSSLDYGMRGVADLASISSHCMTGNTLGGAANRISYVFDLRGPSLSVDTACSSSLVALHQACDLLRKGESSRALVGSINVLLHPYPFVGFTKASMISAHGRCRAFDAAADGYVRAEGGGVLMLKPLSKARHDGDRIHALIMGSGVNADGGRKSSLTIPSTEAQSELMRMVLNQAGMNANDVDYIEAHGTGTVVGDPIEARAIGEVYGIGRNKSLPIGSVKTNFGHLEAASGMAGLIKSILILKNKALVPSLHFENPNPNIAFDDLNLEVVTKYSSLPKKNKNQSIGVNSFGFGGTNAHVLLQSAPPAKRYEHAIESMPPLLLSAHTETALSEQASCYAKLLKAADKQLYYDIAYCASMHRQHLKNRLAIQPKNAEEAVEMLTRFAEGKTSSAISIESALSPPAGIAFIYSGNGAQWVGMGRTLLAQSPRFESCIQELDVLMAPQLGFSVSEALRTSVVMDDTTIAQPLLFAIQVALTTLLREQGITPAAVVGHSVGEVAAAWACGALRLAQAIEVICARSAAQGSTRGNGRMAAVGLSAEEMARVLKEKNCSDIEIAGINSPQNVTIAGSFATLETLQKELKAKEVFFRILDLDYAFHSASMDAIRTSLSKKLGTVNAKASDIEFVSTVTGNVLEGGALTSEYWWKNVRQPVLFAQAISTLITGGCRIFIEISPHAILQRYINECLIAASVSGRVLPVLSRNNESIERITEAALKVHLLSSDTNLNAFFPVKGNFVKLPTYPWQRERYWLPKTSEGYALIERHRVHPLLGWRLKESEAMWENVIDCDQYAFLKHHNISGAIVFPASGYVEMALAASREYFDGQNYEIEELDILSPMIFDAEHARSLRFELSVSDGTFRILSRARLSDDEWNIHAVGRLLGSPSYVPQMDASLYAVKGKEIETATHYGLANIVGLNYGPAFQGFLEGSIQNDILAGRMEIPEAFREDIRCYLLHPILLDVCFQSLVNFFDCQIEEGFGVPFLPVKIGRLRYFEGLEATHFHVRIVSRGIRSVKADFILFNEQGSVVGVVEGCRFRAAFIHKTEVLPDEWHVIPKLLSTIDQEDIKMPASFEWANQVRQHLAEANTPRTQQRFCEGIALLNALVISFAYNAFNTLDKQQRDWLQKTINSPHLLPESMRPFFLWLVCCLKDNNLLSKKNGIWHLEHANAPPEIKDIWDALLADFPDSFPVSLFVGRVGHHLAALLNAEEDVASFYQSLQKSPCWEMRLEAFQCTAIHYSLRTLLHEIGNAWPSNRRLRILEISEGTSHLSRDLISQFPADRLDYVIAEQGDERVAHLKAEYQSDACIHIAALNKDLSFKEEIGLPDKFDVIIIYHALSCAPDPAATLSNMRLRLAAGGKVFLAERYASYAADFISGLDPKWWRGVEGKSISSLRDPPHWAQLLKSQGFEEIKIVTQPADDETKDGAYLLLAHSSQELKALAKPAADVWLLISNVGTSAHMSEALASLLKLQGQQVIQILISEGLKSGYHFLASAKEETGRIDHVVYLAGAGEEYCSDNTRCVEAMHLAQALAQRDMGALKLWLITSGGALVSHRISDEKINPSEAALWGLGWVIMNEFPTFKTMLVDVAFDIRSNEASERLMQTLLAPGNENEIMLTREARFGLRVQRRDDTTQCKVTEDTSFRLDFQSPGQLRNLIWLPQEKRELSVDEIEVRPAMVGLNFRDVMYAMGLLPDEAVEQGFSGATLGLEFAGTISRMGADSKQFHIGDRVMGFGAACFASDIVTKANAVAKIPESWTFADAATVPTAFFTAYYALKHLANIQPGERVLIHGAAGGVGMAAIQVARMLGAEIFATAGSEEKRDFVKLLGVDYVMDSRTLAFADDILQLTLGEGIDVVLNSLAKEGINRNLRILKSFGRFLELGKRDFFENTHIGLRPFKNNISYFGVDADQLLIAKPQLAQHLFHEIMEHFDSGKLSPLPSRIFTAERVVEAFRTMQQSRHIGKVVIDMTNPRVKITKSQKKTPSLRFNKHASYIVTGGLQGFGLESACWLAEHGAGEVVLLSRRGMQTPGAVSAMARIEALGARGHVFSCDVAQPEMLKNVLLKIQSDLLPLRGILHAAMVVDDGLLINLNAERFNQVLSPKIQGAWNLHHLTLGQPLDHFILYSSVTTSIGNPGQGNYVAANSYLESFAAWRRMQGLPALCVAWGAIDDAGYLARNASLKDNLAAKLGAKPMSARQALKQLEKILLGDNQGNITVANVDWKALTGLLPSANGSRFNDVRGLEADNKSCNDNVNDIHAFIAGKSLDEVRQWIKIVMTGEVAKILCINPERIDPARSLYDLGMDSLMAVELALAIEQRFHLHLPAMAMSESSNSIDHISVRVTEKLCQASEQKSSDNIEAVINAMAIHHAENMSAEDLSQIAADVRQQLNMPTELAS